MSALLPAGSIPVPNALPAGLADDLAARLAPSGPPRYRQLIAEVICAFGIIASLSGLGWVLPAALATALHHVTATVQVPPNHAALLNEALAALREAGTHNELFAVLPERSENPMIRLHARIAEAPAYEPLGWRLHVGLVGKYEQLLRAGAADAAAALGNACSTVAIVTSAVPPEAATRGWQPTLAELTEHVGRMPRQRPAPNGSTRYQPGTASSYASIFHQVLLDRAREADFVSRGGGRGGERIGPRDLMIADLLAPHHPARLDYTLDAYHADLLERTEIRRAAAQPTSVEPAPDPPVPTARPPRSAAAQAHLDPGATVDDPGRLTADVLARINRLLDAVEFIPDDITRLSTSLAVQLALHARRGPDFTARLQVGRLAHVHSGPLYLPGQHLVVYQPIRYYGRMERLVRLHDAPESLTADWQAVKAFREHFPGYQPADVVAAIPLPPPVAAAASALWARRAPELDAVRPAPLLVWRDELDQLRPMTPAVLHTLLGRLSEMLRGEVFHHPDLAWSHFYRSFDALYTDAGLSAVDRYHISERAWYADEMPVRYTLRRLEDLAAAYHAASERVLDVIGAAAAAQGQPLARPAVAYRPWPGLRMGSWHVPDDDCIRAIINFLSRPRPGTLEPANTPAAWHAHNQRTRAALVWTGVLCGPRDMEYPRLERRHIAADGASFAIPGKGGQVRVLPLYPALRARFRGLLRGRPAPNAPLFTLYRDTARPQALTTTDVNREFAAVCRYLQLPEIDIYGLRHKFRTHLVDAGVSDAACNALMGHGRDFAHGFAFPALTDALREEYARGAAYILKILGLRP